MTFTDQGNENYISKKPNIDKIVLVGEILDTAIKNFQNLYYFPKNTLFEQEILSCILIDEEELIRTSFQKEPPANMRVFSDFSVSADSSSSDTSLDDNLLSHSSSSPSLSSDSNNNNNNNNNITTSCSENILSECEKEEASSDSIKTLTIPEKRNILRNMKERDPRSWNRVELFVLLESWDIPEDRCLLLSENIVINSTSLIQLDNKLLAEYGIKEVGLRIKIKKQVDAFKDFYVLLSTYGRVEKSSSPDITLRFDKKPIANWVISDIRDWLDSLECGGYGELFDTEQITGKELKDMEEADLIRIGIKPLGHRKKILRSLISFNKKKLSGTPFNNPSLGHRLGQRASVI